MSQSNGIVEFDSYLLGRPTADALLELIVLVTCRHLHARAASIAILRQSGCVAQEYSFGTEPSAHRNLKEQNIWDDNPVTRSLLLPPASVRVETRSGSGYPWNLMPTVVVSAAFLSLTAPAFPASVLTIGTARSFSQSYEEIGFLADVGRKSNLYLGLAGFLADGYSDAITWSSDAQRTILSHTLSPRQETVLGLVCQGLKNKEIAYEVGYSESLVRQETIEIYRKLGVRGRHEAAKVAKRLGIVPPRDGSLDDRV